MTDETYKHPEWKRLYDAIAVLIMEQPEKKLFTYQELEALAGIDITTSRGRQQFDRFNKECRATLNIHWENVRKKGYRIVESCEHASCSVKRVKKAAKQLKRSKHIAEATDLSKLNPDQAKALVIVSACVGTLIQHMKENTKAIKKLATVMEQPKLMERTIQDKTLAEFMDHEGVKH